MLYRSKDAIGAITFQLFSDKSVDISCLIPETEKMSVEELTRISEDYAELMMYINEGLLTNKIIDFLKDTAKTSHLEQDKLFFENVLVFWALHHVNHNENRRYRPNQPLIRPSKVFGG